MKIIPNFEVTGDATESDIEKVRNAMNNVFTNPWHTPNLYEISHKKTEEQISILKYINEETNKLLIEAGVEPFDIPLERYLILNESDFNILFETSGASGITNDASPYIGILYEDTIANFSFAKVAMHETLHFKSKKIWEVHREGDKIPVRPIKVGFVVNYTYNEYKKNGKKYSHFTGLQEAIVESQTKIFFSKMIFLPELAKDFEYTHSEEFKAKRRKISIEEKVDENKIVFIDSNGNPTIFSYLRFRKVLIYLCTEISKDFNDKYQTREDVFKEFIKVNFTCDHTNTIKLVESSFGVGAYKLLEEMAHGEGSLDLCIKVYSELAKRRQNITHSEKLDQWPI